MIRRKCFNFECSPSGQHEVFDSGHYHVQPWVTYGLSVLTLAVVFAAVAVWVLS